MTFPSSNSPPPIFGQRFVTVLLSLSASTSAGYVRFYLNIHSGDWSTKFYSGYLGCQKTAQFCTKFLLFLCKRKHSAWSFYIQEGEEEENQCEMIVLKVFHPSIPGFFSELWYCYADFSLTIMTVVRLEQIQVSSALAILQDQSHRVVIWKHPSCCPISLLRKGLTPLFLIFLQNQKNDCTLRT